MLVSHPRLAGVATALVACLSIANASTAAIKTYNFEGLATGTVVSGQQTNGQFLPNDPYPDFELSAVGNQATNSLVIFDSSNPTFTDIDLGTPNVDFGGPGQGLGGEMGMPGENRIPQGKILIIPENLLDLNRDGRVDQPDDNAHGGTITIDWEFAGILTELVLIDIEEQGATVDLFMGNQLVQSFPVPALGDNSQVRMQTVTTSPIDRTVITLPGSGALASLTFGDLPAQCNIAGPTDVCVGNTAFFTTDVPESFNRQWSVTSSPSNICAVVGSTTGSSLQLEFGAVGTCTVTLTVTDPNDPNNTETCSQTVSVGQPPCNIAGDTHACIGSTKNYITTVPATYGRNWSVTSNPPGICTTVGPTNGGSVSLQFTGAGVCTLSLAVVDPSNPENCSRTCDYIITVDPLPPCDVTGAESVCAGVTELYTTTVSAAYARSWSVTSVPAGIASIVGPTNTGSANVQFTGAGSVTVTLSVTDPNDPEDCGSECSVGVTVNPSPECSITGPDLVCAGSPGNLFTISSAVVGATMTSVVSGNGTIVGSNLGSPISVTAGAAGSFTITTTTVADGCTSTCMKTVEVGDQPTCTVTGPDAVCAGSTGNQFSVSGGSQGSAIAWSISGSGSIFGPADGGSVSVTAGASGSFTLQSIMSTGACADTCTKTVTINPVPTCDIAGPDAVCAGSTGSVYTITSGVAGATFTSVVTGNGSIEGSNAGSPISVTAGAAGSFTITTTSVANGCTTTCTKTVTVNPLPTCSIDGPDAACTGSTGNLYTLSSNVAGATFTTQISGNGSIVGSNAGSPISVTAGAAGSFTLTTTSVANGCTTTCEKTVTVNGAPTCDITGPEAVCGGSEGNIYDVSGGGVGSTYAWSITGNGSIDGAADGASVSVTAGASGSFTLQSIVATGLCADTCSVTVSVNPAPTCSISGDDAVCGSSAENLFTITSNVIGATFLTEISGNGTIIGPVTGPSVSVTAGASGSFTLTTTVVANGCTSTCQKTVTVNPVPTCSVSGPETVCTLSTGNQYSVSGTAGATFSWDITGQGTIDGATTGSTVSVSAGAAGGYTLTVTVSLDGCSSTCTLPVTVTPAPTCTIDGPESVCTASTGNGYSVTAQAGATYAWSVTGNGSIVGDDEGSSISVTAGAAGGYTVSLTVTLNGCVSTCTLPVTVSPGADCGISADDFTLCAGETATFSISNPVAGATYEWSLIGNASFDGGNTGTSVDVTANGGNFTISVDVTAPGGCLSSCSELVTVLAAPVCTISGAEGDTVCVGSLGLEYSVPVQAGATYAWSLSGDGAISGSSTGSTVTVNAAEFEGSFTLSVTVTLNGCSSTCSLDVELTGCVDCWLTGSGCLKEGEGNGQKAHSFSGNVGPQPSGSWEHKVKDGNESLFNFHSHDARVTACWQDLEPGPCSPSAPSNNVLWSGTGKYSIGTGTREFDATFVALAKDYNEGGGCGTKDYYEITVYDTLGNAVFEASGSISCGNLQVHEGNAPESFSTIVPATSSISYPSPNPFRGATRLNYAVEGAAQTVEISVFDVSGRVIRRLENRVLDQGRYETSWDGRNDEGSLVVGGMYFVRVVSGNTQAVTRVMFVR